MRVFVIGGTGFIGSAVVSRLIMAGNEVAVLQRRPTPQGMHPQALPIAGSYQNLPELADAVYRYRPDAIVDLWAMVAPQAQRVFAAFAGKVGRYVVASSGDVYANYGGLMRREKPFPQHGPLAEDAVLRVARYPYRGARPRPKDDPQHFLDDYDKVAVEEAAQRTLGRAGTILRLPMVYGPGNRRPRFVGLLRRMVDNRPAIIVTQDHARWRATYGYVEDVAEAVLLAATSEHTDPVYNVGESVPTSWGDWIGLLGQAVGWRGSIVEAPFREAPPHVVGISHAMDLSYPLILDTRRIRQGLGFAETADVQEALRATIESELAAPEPLGTRPRDTYRDEDRWLAGARLI